MPASAGEWDFDALKIREQHHNVLEIVGFELLRTSSDLPRQPGFDKSQLSEEACHASGVSVAFLIKRRSIVSHIVFLVA